MSTRNRTHLRAHIAHEAARLMLEGGIQDYALAKRKAAQQLQVLDNSHLPRNDEIEQALYTYQRLFRSEHQPQHLSELRQAASSAMQFLADFRPFLVGPVLSGTADEHSTVSLHLFAEPSEEVGLFLLQHGIPHKLIERRLRLTPDEIRAFPTYRFIADSVPVELVVMPYRARKQPPLSPVDGRPMRRANLSNLQAIMEAHSEYGAA